MNCYEHEECEYNAQPLCCLPSAQICPHGVAQRPTMSLIEREALIKALRKKATAEMDLVDVLSILSDVPTIDAAPVVNEKWVWREEWDNHPETHSCDLISCGWYCTGCGIELGDYLTKATGQTVILDDDFCKPKLTCCPNCGCKMKEARQWH